MNRKILSLLLLVVIALPQMVLAESTRRGVKQDNRIESDASGRLRRGVRPPAKADPAQLTGRVLDASGNPLAQVRVDVGSSSAITDEDGEFTMAVFAGIYTAKVSLVGYETLNQQVTLTAGANSIEFRLNPGPTAQLRLTNGTTYTIDANSTEFGYVVPFVGYEKGTFLDLCINGNAERLDLSEIARVNGPAQAAGNTGCCEFNNTQQISLTLRDGSSVTAVMVDTCQGSKMDVIAFDRVAKEYLFIPLANVQEIVFP